jgi:hypothetical protein
LQCHVVEIEAGDGVINVLNGIVVGISAKKTIILGIRVCENLQFMCMSKQRVKLNGRLKGTLWGWNFVEIRLLDVDSDEQK